MIQQNINLIVGTLTLVSNIAFVAFLVAFFTNPNFKSTVLGLVNKYILNLIFVLSLSAMVGSLVYSNIAGFPPCELCWIQRIFMYPQTLLSFLAIIWKDKGIVSYLFPMTILGGLVAFYQSLSNWGFGGSILPCTSVGGACSKVYVITYGYITIPFMALSVFVYLAVITLLYYKSVNERI